MIGSMTRLGLRVALLAVSGLVAACSSSGGSPTPQPTAAPSSAPSAGGSAAAGATVSVHQNMELGSILTGPNGNTIYVFEKDSNGTTACTGTCAQTWPPLTVPSGSAPSAGAGVTGTLATIQRPDGTVQVTVNGAPVYYYSGDTAPDQAMGQGFKDLWYVVGPDGKKIENEAGGSPSPAAPQSSCATKYCY
jgi:predicted lipoprotein with Yx(FWY)xxD motif